jgi:hypothetical protein
MRLQIFYTNANRMDTNQSKSSCLIQKLNQVSLPKEYEFFWPFVSANLLQILKIDLSFDPNFDA